MATATKNSLEAYAERVAANPNDSLQDEAQMALDCEDFSEFQLALARELASEGYDNTHFNAGRMSDERDISPDFDDWFDRDENYWMDRALGHAETTIPPIGAA